MTCSTLSFSLSILIRFKKRANKKYILVLINIPKVLITQVPVKIWINICMYIFLQISHFFGILLKKSQIIVCPHYLFHISLQIVPID